MGQNLINDACKAAVAAGFPKSHFAELESTLRRWYNGSGMDWTVQRLKSLQNYKLQSASNQEDVLQHNHLDWFKQDSNGLPTDPGIRRLFEKSDRYFYQISGVVINSLSRQPNQKDKTKWYSTARLPMLDTTPRDDLDINFKYRGYLDRDAIKNLAIRTISNMQKYDQFLPSSISSTSIPGHNGHVMNIKLTHKDGYVLKDLDSTLEAWNASLASAPLMLSDYFLTQSANIMGTRYDVLSEHDVTISEKYRSLGTYIQMRQDGHEFGSEGVFEDMYFEDSTGTGTGYTNQDSIIAQQVVGHVAMLSKPGNKVRTVANPNQVVQFALRPFGDALGDFVSELPGVFFTDQEQGKAAVQSIMRKGHSVASVDMTAATDTIDNRRALQMILPTDDMFVEGRDKGDTISAVRAYRRSIELFYDVSNAQWDIDPMDDGVSKVSFNRGAPLGTRPSFPLLTLTNWFSAAMAANRYMACHPEEDFPSFAIVGDDICMDARILDGYHHMMNDQFGGATNADKTVTSNDTAEFCGSIIHPYSLFPKKPRYLSSDRYHNALVLNDMAGLHKWERNQVRAARCMSISGLDRNINSIIGIPLDDRIVMRSANALLGQSETQSQEYSYDTLFRRLKDRLETSVATRFMLDARSIVTNLRYIHNSSEGLGNKYPWLQPLLHDPTSDHSIQVTMATRAERFDHVQYAKVPIGKDFQRAMVRALRKSYDAYKHNDDLRLKVIRHVNTGIAPTGDLYVDLDSCEAVFAYKVNNTIQNVDMSDDLRDVIRSLNDALRYHASSMERVKRQQRKEQLLWTKPINQVTKQSNFAQPLSNSLPFLRSDKDINSTSTRMSQASISSFKLNAPSKVSSVMENSETSSLSNLSSRQEMDKNESRHLQQLRISQQLLKESLDKERRTRQKIRKNQRAETTPYPTQNFELTRRADGSETRSTPKPSNHKPSSSDDLEL